MHGISRRSFLAGAAAGLAAGAAGAAGAWWASRRLPPAFDNLFGAPAIPPAPSRATPEIMPGRYPGRVIEVRHPHAVGPEVLDGYHPINHEAVSDMVDRGMADLTGVSDPDDVRAAWGTFFEKDDVVGIKVNPVGRAGKGRIRNAIGSISNHELVVKVVRCLEAVGLPRKNIIVFERYGDEFADTEYVNLVERDLPGVRWAVSAQGYSGDQVDIQGFDNGRNACSVEMAKHVVGYDPDVFTVMGYCAPDHDPKDERRFRSHLSLIVSRMINKMITLPVLKDHRSGGVTLALKNMSHGMNNNVARSHLANIAHGVGPMTRVLGPNQCNTFIPQAVSQLRLRQKATLHILDGLVGVYEGGPGGWNRTWGTWRHQGLFFATDPVALDHVGWDIINEKRAEEGWAPVERMGWLSQTPAVQVASGLAPLAETNPYAHLTLRAGADHIQAGRASESFNVRQPDHVTLAGRLGLGNFDRDQIYYRRVTIGGEPGA